jgi:DNA-binding transcriptional LysR family regulator
MGSAIVPLLTVDTGDPRIVAVDLGDAVEPRLVGIGRHRDRYASPAARAFIDTALAA